MITIFEDLKTVNPKVYPGESRESPWSMKNLTNLQNVESVYEGHECKF